MSDSEVVQFLAHEVTARGDDEKRCCTKTYAQRVLDRDKHFQKRLWTKDSHGGPYRKVASASQMAASASQNAVDSIQPVKPGYEVTKRAPTTNFVGNHMTQGAIDLVQAELGDFPQTDLLLLQDKPYITPISIAAHQLVQQAAIILPIDSYTWRDTGTHICIRIPVPAALSSHATAECNVQRQTLNITLSSSDAHSHGQATYSLNLHPLFSEVKPEACSCLLNGWPVTDHHSGLSPDTMPPVMQASRSAGQVDVNLQQQPCSDSAKQPQGPITLQPQQTLSHQAHGAEWPSLTVFNQEAAARTGIIAMSGKLKSGVLITLAKAHPNQTWQTLTGPKPIQRHQKLLPAQPSDMAALRRALIQQRQQKQLSKHSQAEEISTALVKDATPSNNQTLSYSHFTGVTLNTPLVQAKPAVCGSSQAENASQQNSVVPGQQHEAAMNTAQRLVLEADTKNRQGDHAEACKLYQEAVQQLSAPPQPEVADLIAHAYCCMAECFMHTGCHCQAVEACNKGQGLDCNKGSLSTCIKLLITRALAYEQLEIFAPGLADFEKVLRLDSANCMAQHGACRLRLAIKSLQQAATGS